MPIYCLHSLFLPIFTFVSLPGVCLPRETALFSVSAFPYPTVCIMPECLFASLHLCQIYFCLFLPWDPGGLGLNFSSLSAQELRSWFSQRWTHQAGPRLGTAVASPPSATWDLAGEGRLKLFHGVRGREEPIAPQLLPRFWAQHTYILVKFSSSSQTWIQITNGGWTNYFLWPSVSSSLKANSTFPGAIKYVAHGKVHYPCRRSFLPPIHSYHLLLSMSASLPDPYIWK